MDLFSGAIGAILGGVATVYGTHVLNRPRMSVRLFDVELTPLQPKTLDGVAEEIIQNKAKDFLITPAETLDIFRRHDYLKVPSTTFQHPLLFTWFLYQANRDNENVRIGNEAMPQIVKELKTFLRTDQHEEFCKLYGEHQDEFWAHVNGDARRGKLIVNGKQEDLEEKFPVHPDADGDFIVNLGRINLVFTWAGEKTHRDNVKAVADSLSWAISHWDKQRLETVIQYFEGVSWNDPMLKEAADHIESMLQRYSRIICRGVLTNSGRTGASVLGNGTLKLLSNGFRLDKGTGKEIKANLSVGMHLVTDNRVSAESAISIPPGSSVPFVASSDFYLYQANNYDEFIGIYGSERMCEFELIDAEGKTLRAPKVKFGPNKALQRTR